MSEEKSVADRLRDAQTKIKQFAGMRDQIMRDVGAEERKLEETFEKLRELGIENPEQLSTEQLQAMITELQGTLETKLGEIESQLVKGETLMSKYQELQSNG